MCGKVEEASYVEVPEGQDRRDHGGRRPAFAVGAVENEGWARVFGQRTLRGLQQLIELLRANANKCNDRISVFEPTLSVSLGNITTYESGGWWLRWIAL